MIPPPVARPGVTSTNMPSSVLSGESCQCHFVRGRRISYWYGSGMTAGVAMNRVSTSAESGSDASLAAGAAGAGLRAGLTRYYSLTKPRVLYGNLLTVVAGYFLASRGGFHTWPFLALVLGSTLVIASACVLNNVLDRDIDAAMVRTRHRVTVTGSVGARSAGIYAFVLAAMGLALLVTGTNWFVVAAAVGGFGVYVLLYGMLSKRLSVHGTLVGSVSGAAPILGGYLAGSGRLDLGAVLAFLAVFLWQLPEFYAIAIYRRDEYAHAGIPVISVVSGISRTTAHILVYTVAFVLVTLLLPAFGYTGLVYTLIMGGLGIGWIALAIAGRQTCHTIRWARRMFAYSLIMILALCILFALGPILP